MKAKDIHRYIVLDTGLIIDTCTWGMGSWGDSYCQYGLEFEDDKVYETTWTNDYDGEEMDTEFLGKIVYSTDIPLQICECISARSEQPEYREYGIDVDKYFGMSEKQC